MSLESSDLNDGTILHATRQIAGPNDTVKFSITLPSGREFTSEYFQNERKREALHAWLGAVRQQVVSESEEAEAQAKRLYFERQAEEKRKALEEPSLIVPGPLHYEPPAESPRRPTNAIQPEMVVEDALSHARRMLDSARQRQGVTRALHLQATKDLETAERNLNRWANIVSALSSEPEADSE